MSRKPGYLGKVTIDGNTVVGIGNWSIDGISRAELDDTAMGDEWSKWEFGVKDGGTISFAGNFDADDSDGQMAMINHFDANTDLTNIKFYIDNTSYFEPCQTSGYLHPGVTTSANTVLSYVNITAIPVNTDKGGLGQISFTARVSGTMVLV